MGEQFIEVSHAPGEPWWCECPDAGDVGPHVHCPWGGMHVHPVDPETGEARDG